MNVKHDVIPSRTIKLLRKRIRLSKLFREGIELCVYITIGIIPFPYPQGPWGALLLWAVLINALNILVQGLHYRSTKNRKAKARLRVSYLYLVFTAIIFSVTVTLAKKHSAPVPENSSSKSEAQSYNTKEP